jgi:thiol-disulfide isomerase/thioredoxin
MKLVKLGIGILVCALVVLVCIYYNKPLREGINDEDLSNFTGFVVFTLEKNCDECRRIKPSILLLYEKFPNNVKIVDCTDISLVSSMLTRYNVDKNKMPTILSFKSGMFTTYNGFLEYTDLEDFLLGVMSSRKPT